MHFEFRVVHRKGKDYAKYGQWMKGKISVA